MDRKRFWLMIWSAAWVLTWVGSFYALWFLEPTGASNWRGLNRITAFLSWQGVAALLSIVVFAVSRGWPKGSPQRRLGTIPILAAGVLLALILGVMGWTRLTII